MALPNGDLVTTVFNPQIAYPLDKRMQIDTLNSRDSMSMFIRWEGMEVYVLENSTKYILQGGISNEYWKELGTGSGTGGTTFVGQFATADLLPTSGRSAGDYAFVGTGDDFVQYNWDNIANEWVMVEGQTDMASEFFHIGYKTPLRRPVIFPLFPKDVLVQESGDFVFTPETSVARFIFVGEVEAIRGIETAEEDREIKLVNRTGSDIILRDKASGIPSGSGMDFGGTDYTWVNGSEITLKGNGTYWELAPNNQVAFSDHLDSVNAKVSVGSDGNINVYDILDKFTGRRLSFKKTTKWWDGSDINDGKIDPYFYVKIHNEYMKRQVHSFDLNEVGMSIENSAEENANIFNYAQEIAPNNCRFTLSTGTYKIGDVNIQKDGIYDFSGVVWINNDDSSSQAIDIGVETDFVNIIGLNLNYTGIFYTSSIGHGATYGVAKHGIRVRNNKCFLNYCRISGFSHSGIKADNTNKSLSVLNSICNNNGYSGVFSEGRDFNVLGGEYSYNGGANSSGDGYGDGYGVIGNVGLRGNFKVTGITSIGNRTRNIDSHTGRDIIITNNYTEDCGKAHPQWFNVSFTEALSIRFTQRASSVIVSSNIAKRSTLAGIALSADPISSDYVRNVIISNNILEDNTYNIYIRQNKTEKINIIGNQCITTPGATFQVTPWDININPLGTNNEQWIKSLNISNNDFDGDIFINLVNIEVSEKFNLSFTDNSFRNAQILLNQTRSKLKVLGNYHKKLTVSGGTLDSLIDYSNNHQDKSNDEESFSIVSSYNGKLSFNSNFLYRSNSSTMYVVPSNSTFINNEFIECNSNGNVSNGVRLFSGSRNSEIRLNKMGCVLSPTYAYRVSLEPTCVFIDNKSNLGDFRVEYMRLIEGTSAGINTDFAIIDTINGKYDIGVSPENVDFPFREGSIFTVRQPTIGSNSSFVYRNGGWVPISFSERDRYISGSTNTNFSSTFLWKYVEFSGSSGDVVITSDIAPIGYEFFGEITGGAKTFVAGAGVTLRTPVGQGLVAPTGSRFIVKFKDANDALVTIIKPYTQNGFDVRTVTSTGTIAPALNEGFAGSRLNFSNTTAVTIQGLDNANGQTSLIVVNSHASNNLTIVHNGSATVKYISPTSTDLVVAPKTAVRLEIVGNEMYPLVM